MSKKEKKVGKPGLCKHECNYVDLELTEFGASLEPGGDRQWLDKVPYIFYISTSDQ